MPDDMARALGAGGPLTATIAGKECKVRPLGLQELTEVERDCLDRYVRRYLMTYKKNLDLLPLEQATALMERKMEEAARWEVGDLPPKFAYDPKRIVLSDRLVAWIKREYEIADDPGELKLRRMAAAALDNDMLSQKEYKELTGVDAKPVKVGYAHWWITGSYEGMITFVWVCFAHNGVTREQVANELRGNMALLVDLSREIEHLSSPAVGNG